MLGHHESADLPEERKRHYEYNVTKIYFVRKM